MNEQERKAPIYLLVDISESMQGEPITWVKNGIDMCIQAVRNGLQSSEKYHVSIITFATEAKVFMKLTKVTEIVSIPNFNVGGKTNYAAAIKLLNESLEKDLRENTETEKGDYKAFVVLFSDGKPDIGDHTAELDKLDRRKISYFIAGTTSVEEDCKEVLAKVVQSKENVFYLPGTIVSSSKEGFMNAKGDMNDTSSEFGSEDDCFINDSSIYGGDVIQQIGAERDYADSDSLFFRLMDNLIVGKPYDVGSVNLDDLPPLPSFYEDDILI